jgi:hypothetical protein
MYIHYASRLNASAIVLLLAVKKIWIRLVLLLFFNLIYFLSFFNFILLSFYLILLSFFQHSFQDTEICYQVDPDNIQVFLRLDGFTYNNHTLSVRSGDASSSSYDDFSIPRALEAPQVLELLRQFVSSRYMPDRSMCDLSNVSAEQALMQSIDRLTTGSWNGLLKAVASLGQQVLSFLLFFYHAYSCVGANLDF